MSEEVAGGMEKVLGCSEISSTAVEAAAASEVELGAGAEPLVEPLPSAAPLPLCS